MDVKSRIKVSVRDLVGSVLRTGDLTGGTSLASRAQEGIAGHQTVRRGRPEGYQSEVSVSDTVEGELVSLEIGGRVDGIIRQDAGLIVEEIKTTALPLAGVEREQSPLYWAQLKCYGYLIARREGLGRIGLRLTYYHPETKVERSFDAESTVGELAEFFTALVSQYLAREESRQAWVQERNRSMGELTFPYGGYRRGQRDLSAAVYRAIRDGQKVFAQAPTGVGKTVAVLFPACKAMGEGRTEKIFYLTAKTTTRMVAEKTLDDLRLGGLRCRAVTLTAKEKICLEGMSPCRPEDCQYARGYFDRVEEAVRAIQPEEAWTRPVIQTYARQYRVCSFEYSLDLAEWADVVIGDYNYAFDPRVHLRRFFDAGRRSYTLLIDEAHNLPDRAREMYSAELTKAPVLARQKATRAGYPVLSRVLSRLNKALVGLRKQCGEASGDYRVQKEAPAALFPLLREAVGLIEQGFGPETRPEDREALLDLYFTAQSFLRTGEAYDARYVTMITREGSDVRVRLLCLDPAPQLQEIMGRGQAAVLFSATLHPLEYHIRLLGGDADTVRLRLPSPFPPENLLVAVDDGTGTRFRQREGTYDRVAAMIAAVVGEKTGNYLVYFPSYKYLEEVLRRFAALAPEVRILRQTGGMSEAAREEYLGEFRDRDGETLAGFAVMGGIFGEGIDLVGERLSGAVIVGVGLPQICPEREIIRDYFATEDGFAYAYLYPGMVRVLQAAGRVIRSERDRGVVVLIDDRFATARYRQLYPAGWPPVIRVRDPDALARAVGTFWAGQGQSGIESS